MLLEESSSQLLHASLEKRLGEWVEGGSAANVDEWVEEGDVCGVVHGGGGVFVVRFVFCAVALLYYFSGYFSG